MPRLIFPGVRDIRGYQAMYRDFAAAIRDSRAPEMSLERAIEDHKLMEQVYASERSPRAIREILRLLARTVRRASGRIEDLVFLDVPGRVAKCLLDLAAANERNEVELTQDDLAAFVGATRVSVNRALADLEGLGAVAVGRRRIEIRDQETLRRQVRY